MYLVSQLLVAGVLAVKAFGLLDLTSYKTAPHALPAKDPVVDTNIVFVHRLRPQHLALMGELGENVKFELSEGQFVDGTVEAIAGSRDERVISGTLSEGSSLTRSFPIAFYITYPNSLHSVT
jgi:hypothetical protein